MDNRLLDILVCPICKGPLEHRKADRELVCPRDRLAFPIRDDIPVMLESEARRLDAPVLPPPGPSADPSGETTTGTGGQPRL
ncbi:MAG: Trm112 family protein [Gammaproteobacteria bacterium]